MVQCDRVVGFLLRIIVKYTSLGLGVGGRAQAFLVALLTDIAFIYFSFNILKTMKMENSISAQDMCSSPAASAQFEFAKS